MARRRFMARTLCGVMLGVLALSACNRSPSDAGEPIVFRSFDPPAEVAGLRKAVDKWNSENVVKARIETVAIADALAQYTREVNGGGGPDVSQTAFVWVRDLAKSGLVLDLVWRVGSDFTLDG